MPTLERFASFSSVSLRYVSCNIVLLKFEPERLAPSRFESTSIASERLEFDKSDLIKIESKNIELDKEKLWIFSNKIFRNIRKKINNNFNRLNNRIVDKKILLKSIKWEISLIV